MDVRFSAADEAFRLEVRTWLEENLVGEFAALRGRGGSGDLAHQPQVSGPIDQPPAVPGDHPSKRGCGQAMGGVPARARAAEDTDRAHAGPPCENDCFTR